MSEISVPPYSPRSTAAHYELYKKTVDAKDRAIEIDQPKSIEKNVLRQFLIGTTHFGSDYNSAMRGPDNALKASQDYYTAHKDEIMQEAINDFNNDPANAGKKLNLPESGVPQTAINVQAQPPAQEPKH